MTEGQHQRHAYYNDATPLSAFLARSKKAAATTTTQWPPVTLATRMLFGGSSKEGIGGNSRRAPSIFLFESMSDENCSDLPKATLKTLLLSAASSSSSKPFHS